MPILFSFLEAIRTNPPPHTHHSLRRLNVVYQSLYHKFLNLKDTWTPSRMCYPGLVLSWSKMNFGSEKSIHQTIRIQTSFTNVSPLCFSMYFAIFCTRRLAHATSAHILTVSHIHAHTYTHTPTCAGARQHKFLLYILSCTPAGDLSYNPLL